MLAIWSLTYKELEILIKLLIDLFYLFINLQTSSSFHYMIEICT